MNSPSRRQHCYDHRLKELVRTSGDLSVAAELGIPRSTAMGRLYDSPQQVVTLDVLSMKEQELQHEVLLLRRRIRKLLALLRISRFTLAKSASQRGKGRHPCSERLIARASFSPWGLRSAPSVSPRPVTIPGSDRRASVVSMTSPHVHGFLLISSPRTKSKPSERWPRPISTAMFPLVPWPSLPNGSEKSSRRLRPGTGSSAALAGVALD